METIVDVLSRLIVREQLALEQDLEGLPHERSRGFRTCHGINPVGKPRSNRLIDVDHYTNASVSREVRSLWNLDVTHITHYC